MAASNRTVAAIGVVVPRRTSTKLLAVSVAGSIAPEKVAFTAESVSTLTAPLAGVRPRVAALAAPAQGYTPIDVANLYNFPAGFNGEGQCVAVPAEGEAVAAGPGSQYANYWTPQQVQQADANEKAKQQGP